MDTIVLLVCWWVSCGLFIFFSVIEKKEIWEELNGIGLSKIKGGIFLFIIYLITGPFCMLSWILKKVTS